MPHKTRIFCIGEDAERSIAGHLDTMIPLEVGHCHKIKGRLWVVTELAKNFRGETLADFRPAN